ncbi:MAG: aminoglycoside phosphotransferase family protein [Pirellulales bacterium]
MQLLDEHNAADYLRAARHVGEKERLEIRFLSGGVSNVVLHVRRPERTDGDFVLKQARAQLRVPQPWFCSVERIWREVAVLEICQQMLTKQATLGTQAALARPSDLELSAPESSAPELSAPESSESRRVSRAVHLPRLLFEDRDEYLFAMTAAPLGHSTWKQQLLSGDPQPEIAAACGRLLGTIHAQTWLDRSVAQRLDDRQFFDDLRLDPYYRQIARVHADLATPVQGLLDSVWEHRRALVHGDFSPKNLLVWPAGLMLIDFEVGHFGDPAFDLGFFLTHLILKTFHFAPRSSEYFGLAQTFWSEYRAMVEPVVGDVEWRELESRAQQNTAGCLLARVDGKSRVEYLTRDEPIRQLARSLLLEPARNWDESCERIGDAIGRLTPES